MGRVILAFFLAVILALGLSIFSAWNWVDGQLNKQSWLTNKADTAGESWLILGSDEREGTVGDAGDVTGSEQTPFWYSPNRNPDLPH